jgi:hypothetical protein
MFINIVLAAVASATLANAPAPTLQPISLAKGVTVAHLASPLSHPVDQAFDGRMWHCEGQVCRAGFTTSAVSQSTTRECATVAKKLGAFDSYQTGSDLLAGDALEKCNASAKR